MDRRKKSIRFWAGEIIVQKSLLEEYDIWDFLFVAMMTVTMLAVRAWRIREMIQILFIGVSFFKLKLGNRFLIEILIGRYIFLIWCAYSCVWAIYPNVVLSYMPSVIQSTLLLSAVVIYFSQDSDRHLRLGISMFVSMTIILVIYVFATIPVRKLIQGSVELENRITARGINANQVGVCCSYSILFLLYYSRQSTLAWKLILGFPMLGVALLTGSKKALMTLVLGITLLSFIKTDNPLKKVGYIVLAALAVAGMLWLIYHVDFMYEIIGKRIDGMLGYLISGAGDKSTNSRGNMIKHAMQIFMKKPWTGIGLHNFKQINVYGVYAHNNYAELLACIGIPGFLLYYAVVLKQFLKAIKEMVHRRKSMNLVFVLMICFLANEYATVSYTNEVIQLILGLILGYGILEDRREKRYS